MSGAGKSSVLRFLEDASYYCIDNLPISLIKPFVELSFHGKSELNKVAIGVDIRSGDDLENLEDILNDVVREGYKYELLYLDCSDSVLLRRYKETRRRHPLAIKDRVEQGIRREREKTEFLKRDATYVIDTSTMLTRELKAEIDKIFVEDEQYKNIYITVLSFGFKYGIPLDSDLVFDVRFLPNPYYVPELKYLSGNDAPVRDFVMKNQESLEFLEKISDMCDFLIPNYHKEGKYQLVISIGCTGGKHRSVTLANALFESLKNNGYSVKIEHRDIDKDAKKTDSRK
jgi:UPF0042 nucleotide-binding protein